MLFLTQIDKRYGPKIILQNISFVINPGERVALVGPNGSGKTTLLNIITGRETPDRGQVSFKPADLRLGYLSQSLIFEADDTLADALERSTAAHSQAQAEMASLQAQMANPAQADNLTALTTAYAQAETRFEAAGGYGLPAQLEAILGGLELADLPRNLPVSALSGGQKTRLGLAGLLLRQPHLLLLDEPTNHLDLTALDWLAEWLQDFSGAVLLVSHDRDFLDHSTTRTLILNPETHTLRDFPGPYSEYVAAKTQEQAQQWQAYKTQQTEIQDLHRAAQRLRGQAVMKKGGKGDSGDKFAKGFFSDQSKDSVGRAKQLERRIEQLHGEERVEKPSRRWGLKLDFGADEGGAREVLRLENVGMAFDDVTLFSQLSLSLNHGERVALLGENGSGKTTLLRLIAGHLEPTSGAIHVGRGVKLGYFAQEQDVLSPNSTPFETIRQASQTMSQQDIRNFLHFYLFSGDAVFAKVGQLSFGERARLQLALLVAQGCNFLVLDEPINHLDLPSRERFEEALLDFPGTVLAVTHDRAFVRAVATLRWTLTQGQISVAYTADALTDIF